MILLVLPSRTPHFQSLKSKNYSLKTLKLKNFRDQLRRVFLVSHKSSSFEFHVEKISPKTDCNPQFTHSVHCTVSGMNNFRSLPIRRLKFTVDSANVRRPLTRLSGPSCWHCHLQNFFEAFRVSELLLISEQATRHYLISLENQLNSIQWTLTDNQRTSSSCVGHLFHSKILL